MLRLNAIEIILIISLSNIHYNKLLIIQFQLIKLLKNQAIYQIKSKMSTNKIIPAELVQNQYKYSNKDRDQNGGSKTDRPSEHIQKDVANQDAKVSLAEAYLIKNQRQLKNLSQATDITNNSQIQAHKSDKIDNSMNISIVSNKNLIQAPHPNPNDIKGIDNQSTFICSICAQNYTISQQVVISNCNHSFCITCTKTAVDLAMADRKPITCFENQCGEPIVINHQKKDLKGNNYYYGHIEKRDRKKIKKYIKQFNKNSKNGRCPNCQYIQNKLVTKCKQCLESSSVQLPDSFKKCPNCQKPIQKLAGCNHVTCPCSHQFCFLCLQPWDRSHICQQNIPIRTGLSYVFFAILKFMVTVFIIIILTVIIISFIAFICIISGILFGFFLQIKILEILTQSSAFSDCLKFTLMLLSFIFMPVVVVLAFLPGLLIPIINLCYRKKIFLQPDFVREFVLNAFSCVRIVDII